MRPVNLIPPDERQGDAAPLRTGTLIYVLTAGLALLLLGIVAVALTGKQISDRESQKTTLQQELTQATARANSLAAFSSFRAVQQQRADTVSSLASSRFDWSRVLHELSLVLPSNISLSTLSGTANPNAQVDGGGGAGALTTSIAGPSLQITGCAPGQDAVAGFVSSLQDIDGVTRVGLESSTVSDPAGGSSTGASTSSGSSGATADCPANAAQFQVVVAFDAVPAPSTATASPSVPSSVAPATSGGQQVASTQTP
jgi:Tfp pilus assembly protein PilN